MAVNIVEIGEHDKSLLKEFVKYPITLYKDCPYYVPPLVLDQMQTLDPNKNPVFEHCESQLFLAYKDKKIVGRIAAIVNHEANKIWNNKKGRFSFVDFIDDNEVVDALFAAAETWAKSKGMESIVGPLGFTDLDHEGLLVEGFDKVATVATTYSYPYYKEQVERLGFEKEVDWVEFLIKVPDSIPERHKRISDIVIQRYGLKVRKFSSLNEFKPYIEALFRLINNSYQHIYGFVALTDKQIKYYAEIYGPMLQWEIVTIVLKEDTDEMVAFGVGMPNLSKAMQKAQGKFMPTGWYHLWRGLKSKKSKLADLMLIGVSQEYQGKGLNAIIFSDFIVSTKKRGFTHLESNPELEINNKMVSLWDGFDAVNHKRRRAYVKQLS